MQVETIQLRTRIMRAAMTAGWMVLLALQPESARVVEAAWVRVGRGTIARNLVLSDQARRYLSLQYQSYPTEFMGCMVGEVRGTTVVVSRIAPADVDPSHSGRTHVVPTQSCEQAGWAETVGVIHSHPDGRYCWYFFPGTSVLTSDGQSFLRQPYPVDAIMCGDHVVWISRDMEQREVGMAGAGEFSASTTPAR